MRSTLYLLLVISILVSCTQDAKIANVNISSPMRKYIAKAKEDTSKIVEFPICELIGNKDWDQLSIIGSYVSEGTIDSLNIKNLSAVEPQLDSLKYTETKTAFIFSKMGVIVAFTTIDNGELNSNFIVLSQRNYNVNNHIFKRSICDSLVIKANKTEVILTNKAYAKANNYFLTLKMANK